MKRVFFVIGIIVCFLFPFSVMATNVQFLLGVGHWEDIPGEGINSVYLQGGASVVQPFRENSAFGVDYSVNYLGADDNIEEHIFSSHLLLVYRYYPGNYITRKSKIGSFEPFLSISPGVIWVDHNTFAPGGEIQLGVDIVYDFFLLDPFSIISYPLSKLSKTSPLLTFALTGGVYFKDDKKIFLKGVKIYTGTYF